MWMQIYTPLNFVKCFFFLVFYLGCCLKQMGELTEDEGDTFEMDS